TMSKLVNCGIPLAEVIGMASNAPALAMKRPELGHLSVGAVADRSVIAEVEREYEFRDVRGLTRPGTMVLEPDVLIVGGVEIEPEARPFENAREER
ncbi:MAG: amidohydrolase/deacetylase family metallohydrolase, partial [Alphaproteobacteria bacterium]